MSLALVPRESSELSMDSPQRVADLVYNNLPCRAVEDPDLWFADSPADLETAKALCAACPLRMQCLAGALERQEPWGVWGGEIFEHGTVVPRKRPRGRPRKDESSVGIRLKVA